MSHLPQKSRSARGYTLVEVMVATLILGLSVVAVVTMLREGRNSEDYGEVQRQASILLRSAMEDTAYDFRKYAVYNGLLSHKFGHNDTLRLDTLRIFAICSVTVGAQQTENWTGTNQVKFKRIVGIVRWTLDGVLDSLTLSKRIAPVF